MNVKIKILLQNKTLDTVDIEEGFGILDNNRLILKNDKNVFKIYIESNIIFEKETEEYILRYKFIKDLYTNNTIHFSKLNYDLMVDIIAVNIELKSNKIIINYDKYINDEKEKCKLVIEYWEGNYGRKNN